MVDLTARIDAFIRAHELIEPGGEVTCLVSGGADSTCLWHALGVLGYRVSAVHVNHGLRGAESRPTRASAVMRFGAEIVERHGRARPRRSSVTSATRLTGGAGCAPPGTRPPTRSRRCSTGSSRAVDARDQVRREDGVVRPLLTSGATRRAGTAAPHGLAFRTTRPTRTRPAA